MKTNAMNLLTWVLVSEDATFEDVGLSKSSGKQQIKNIFEYHAGVKTNVQFRNCKSEGNSVHCQMLLRNDTLDAIGIGELEYSSCIFTFKDDYSRMFMPDGRFIYNLENGRDVVPLLRKWSKEQKPDS